jgi:hypothetical protein
MDSCTSRSGVSAGSEREGCCPPTRCNWRSARSLVAFPCWRSSFERRFAPDLGVRRTLEP